MNNNSKSSFGMEPARLEPQDPTAYPHAPHRGNGLPPSNRLHYTVESTWDEPIAAQQTAPASGHVSESIVIRPRKL